MKHYSAEELEIYRNGGMGVLRGIQCSAHLKQCSECRHVLDSLKKDDELIAELRAGLRIYRELSEPVTPHSRTE